MLPNFKIKEAFDTVVADAALGGVSLVATRAAAMALNTHYALLGRDTGYRELFDSLSKLGKSSEGKDLRVEIGKAADEPDPFMANMKLAWAALQHPIVYTKLRYYQERLFAKAAPLLQHGITGS
ncbi:MAG: hypothetical protein RBR86_08570 [Pseudobdellovibrionaceae bacterium]|jgi:hypothetical protein|nr:hypothetical protein [Pseudobdellovibrionaceae bacterium]